MAASLVRNRLSPLAMAGVVIGAAIMVAPLVWTILLSLKANAALVGNSGAALSPPYTIENYAAIFGNYLTMRWLLNSLIVSLGTTAGGPSGASRTAVLFIFEVAFGRWEIGYAAAAAELLFLLIVMVTLAQYWATSRTADGQNGR